MNRNLPRILLVAAVVALFGVPHLVPLAAQSTAIHYHFLAIADAWKAAGEAFQLVLQGDGFLTPSMTIILLGATSIFLIVGVIVVRRRGK